MSKSLTKKLARLKNLFKSMGSVIVAYSGGVDSSFLLKVAKDCLNDKVLAVTAVSETYTKGELEFAKKFCKQLKIKHKIIKTNELNDENFSANPKNRCYFCKKELFSKLKEIAHRNRLRYVVDGTNADDSFDFRPGKKAKEELGVHSPLAKIHLTKEEIRVLSKRFNLVSWNKPQMACLASRVQYGNQITGRRLKRIENAEGFLRKKLKIFGNLRVRDYGDLARIEVDRSNISKFVRRNGFIKKLKELGFKYVTVDLEGYRTGSMNNG